MSATAGLASLAEMLEMICEKSAEVIVAGVKQVGESVKWLD
jgi:hypothetical protein